MRSLVCLLLLAAMASAADFSGKWTGTADVILPDGNAQHLSVILQLRQNGGELSGTIGDAAGNESSISQGAIDGNVITFEVQQGDSGPLWKIKLTAAGDELSGEANGSRGGQSLKGRLSLKRTAS